MTRKWLRWLPAAIVPVVVVGGAIAFPLQADADIQLPDKSPAEVLAMVGTSTVRDFSGTVEQTSQLGLPQIPSSMDPGSSTLSALDLITSNHTARVYVDGTKVDGAKKVRVQVMTSLAEQDFVRNGNDIWTYNSDDNSATHTTLSGTDDRSKPHSAKPDGSGTAPTPAQLADRLISAITPSTDVTVGKNTRVAGRSAYDLVLKPRSSTTLVGSVSIAVDAKTGLPLSVAVMATGQKDPAFSVAFTQLTLATPSSALFDFSPPSGAKVTEHAVSPGTGHPSAPKQPGAAPDPDKRGAKKQITTTGSGWSTIVSAPASALPSELTASSLLSTATTKVTGGRLLSTSLLNVLLTTDGRVFAGSVPLAQLQAAASAK
jgi:outer membrane lipoprotein-sorting protein